MATRHRGAFGAADSDDPRSLRRLRRGLVVGVLGLVAMFGGVGWFVTLSLESDHLASHGRVEQASVLEVRPARSSGSDSARLDVVYEVPELPGRRFMSTVPRATAWGMAGRELPVYVDPQDPARNMLVDATRAPAWVTSLLLVVPCALTYPVWRVWRAVRRLEERRCGEPETEH